MYILENVLNSGFKHYSVIIISTLSIVSGILVIISKNPIKSVLFLIGLFLTIALYLFTLNISFIALAYLLVYVGAVSILFLFILMLINVRVSELTTDNNNSIPLSIIIITIFSMTFSEKSFFFPRNERLALLSYTELNDKEKTVLFTDNSINEGRSLTDNLFFVKQSDEEVSLVFSSMWDGILAEMSHISALGSVIYISYSIGILIVGLILLLAMIGAISVTAKSSNKV